MTPCKTQTGGVKLINPKNIGFTPVLNMLTHPDSKIETLSYESLFGFMFELIVDKSATEYAGLTKSQKLFTVKITNFILKIVVIGREGDGGITSRYLPDFFGTQKACELNESFINEARIQQDIWLSSIKGGHPELCPSVANFSLFDNKNSQTLLNYLYTLERTPSITQRIISFLYELIRINQHYSIGIILMPKVMNSVTMKDFGYKTVHDVTLPLDQKYSIMYQAYSNVIAQIARLYILTGIIHVDLHPRNILIQRDNYNHVKSQIIDFGRVVHVVEDPNNPNNRKALFDELFSFKPERIKRKSNDIGQDIVPKSKQKEEYINKFLRIIYPDPSRGNIRWLFNAINSLSEDIQTKILTDAFDILLSNIVKADGSQSILPETIQSYLKKGNLFDTNKDIIQYYFTMPTDIPQISASTIEVPKIREEQLFLSDSDECHIPPAQKMQRDSSTLVDEAQQDANSRTIIDEPEDSSTIVDGNQDSRTIVDDIDDIDDVDDIDGDVKQNGWTTGFGGNKTKRRGKPKPKSQKRKQKKGKKNKTRKNNKRR
jgi:hypothetical protein